MRPAAALIVALLASRGAVAFVEAFLCVAVAVVPAPFVAFQMLNCCGFGALGIAAGDPFAILQSAGMGGYGAAIVKLVASIVGGAIALLLRLFR
ncbi:hypothetical protein LQW54_001087 [Pestalotiopsis sp. IQ-011]